MSEEDIKFSTHLLPEEKERQLKAFCEFKKLLLKFIKEIEKKNFEKYADLSIELKKIYKEIEPTIDLYIEKQKLRGGKDTKRISGHSFSRLELAKFYLAAFIDLKQTLHKDYLKISLRLLDGIISELRK